MTPPDHRPSPRAVPEPLPKMPESSPAKPDAEVLSLRVPPHSVVVLSSEAK